MVLAVDDVADAPYGEAERDARRRAVGRGANGDRAASQRDDETAEHASDRRTPDGDATGPDLRDELGVRGVAADDAGAARPTVEDMEDARADDPADDAPRRDGRGIGFSDAELAYELRRKPHAEEDADRGEDAVPCERERAEVDAGIEVDGYQLANVRDTS